LFPKTVVYVAFDVDLTVQKRILCLSENNLMDQKRRGHLTHCVHISTFTSLQ